MTGARRYGPSARSSERDPRVRWRLAACSGLTLALLAAACGSSTSKSTSTTDGAIAVTTTAAAGPTTTAVGATTTGATTTGPTTTGPTTTNPTASTIPGSATSAPCKADTPTGVTQTVSSEMIIDWRPNTNAADAWVAYVHCELIAPEGVQALLPEGSRPIGEPLTDGSVGPKLVLYQLPSNSDPLLEAQSLIDKGKDAAPNYVMELNPGWMFGPDGPPTAASPEPTKLPAVSVAGSPVKVGVVDTGFTAATAKSFDPKGVLLTGSTSGDAEGPTQDALGRTPGHGTFIASLLRRWLPEATIVVKRIVLYKATTLATDTLADQATVDASKDSELAKLIRTMTDSDVLNLSLGTYGLVKAKGTTGIPLATRDALLGRRKSAPNVFKSVAAAGNDGVTTPFYPAAFSRDALFDGSSNAPSTWLVAAGGTNAKSNTGDWVTFVGTGRDVLGYRPAGTTASPTGWVRWSGTSFSTPCVLAWVVNNKTWDANKGANSVDCLTG